MCDFINLSLFVTSWNPQNLTTKQALIPSTAKNHGGYSVIPDGRKMYIRFANVQYARIAHDCIGFRPQWQAAYITHAEFVQVKSAHTQGDEADPC